MKDRVIGLSGVFLLVFLVLCSVCVIRQTHRTQVETILVPKEVTEAHNKAEKAAKEAAKEERVSEKPKIAITFDDGPDAKWTNELLDGLKERGVQATFFLIGDKIAGNEEIIRRMYEEGHLIGNHTFTHIQLTMLSDKQACEEITKTNEAVYAITGEYPQFIRAPFGSYNDRLECEIEMFPIKWTIDPLDWTTDNRALIVDRVISHAQENSIILLHDIFESSVLAALDIIDQLQAKGYQFVTVEQLMLE